MQNASFPQTWEADQANETTVSESTLKQCVYNVIKSMNETDVVYAKNRAVVFPMHIASF